MSTDIQSVHSFVNKLLRFPLTGRDNILVLVGIH